MTFLRYFGQVCFDEFLHFNAFFALFLVLALRLDNLDIMIILRPSVGTLRQISRGVGLDHLQYVIIFIRTRRETLERRPLFIG